MAQSWLICEESGRWAAALRIAFDRSEHITSRPRLTEVRNLAELSNHPGERQADLVLVEVGTTSAAQTLEFAARLGARGTPFAALLKDALERSRLADLLWEAGAVEVVSSPRDLRGLLERHGRSTAHSRAGLGESLDSQSLADWAWSLLPWQGT